MGCIGIKYGNQTSPLDKQNIIIYYITREGENVHGRISTRGW
jgi:hypothetical protein